MEDARRALTILLDDNERKPKLIETYRLLRKTVEEGCRIHLNNTYGWGNYVLLNPTTSEIITDLPWLCFIFEETNTHMMYMGSWRLHDDFPEFHRE